MPICSYNFAPVLPVSVFFTKATGHAKNLVSDLSTYTVDTSMITVSSYDVKVQKVFAGWERNPKTLDIHAHKGKESLNTMLSCEEKENNDIRY